MFTSSRKIFYQLTNIDQFDGLDALSETAVEEDYMIWSAIAGVKTQQERQANKQKWL